MNQHPAIEYPKVFARFYDLIYHQLRDGIDHAYFLEEIAQTQGKVLEIGVGTGRFFLDALHRGAAIHGLDISPSMLEILSDKLKPEERHRISLQNMTDFHYDFRYNLILAPFRVMMHLFDKEEQIKALNHICNYLEPGGKFIFDVFIPDLNQLITGIDQRVDYEGEYEPGKRIRRIVSTRPDLNRQLINITFRFEWEENQGWQAAEWMTALRYFFRYELEHLIERTPFDHYQICGDYAGNPVDEKSKEFVVTCYR